MKRSMLLAALSCSTLALATPALAAKPLRIVVEVESSKGLHAGDAVVSAGKTIGEVAKVGFGEKDTVDVDVEVDDEFRDQVRKASTFVVNEPSGKGRPTIELFVIDPASPPATAGTRFRASRSVADVWLRRGRINAEELQRSLDQGLDAFRKNVDELQRSPEWAKFKDQLARLSAQLTVTGTQLSQILNDQLPKLQKELDDLYGEYQRELDKRQPTPHD